MLKKNLFIIWLPVITMNKNLSTLTKNNYFLGDFFLKKIILQQNIPFPILFFAIVQKQNVGLSVF
jgi:hypothetical protein